MFAAMNLADLRKDLNLSQGQLAAMLVAAGYSATQSLVSQWELGNVTISDERAIQIVRVSDGAISRAVLRPDLFGDAPAANDQPADAGRAVAGG